MSVRTVSTHFRATSNAGSALHDLVDDCSKRAGSMRGCTGNLYATGYIRAASSARRTGRSSHGDVASCHIKNSHKVDCAQAAVAKRIMTSLSEGRCQKGQLLGLLLVATEARAMRQRRRCVHIFITLEWHRSIIVPRLTRSSLRHSPSFFNLLHSGYRQYLQTICRSHSTFYAIS